MKPGLNAIHLHGSLGAQFGDLHHLDVATPAEAIRALTFLFKDFRRALLAGTWQIIRGDPENGLQLEPDSLGIRLGKAPLHIIAAPIGAGRGGGTIKLVAGIAIMAAAIYFSGGAAAAAGGDFAGAAGALGTSTGVLGITYGQIALVGLALTLTGISNLIAPAPKTANDKQSYAQFGPVNTATEGSPVPVIYGTVRCGSLVCAMTMTTVNYTQSLVAIGAEQANSKSGVSYVFQSTGTATDYGR
jgi:predicted phage tail protein